MSREAPQFGYGLRDGMSKALENYDAPGPDYEVGNGYGRQQKDFPNAVIAPAKPGLWWPGLIILAITAIATGWLLADNSPFWWIAPAVGIGVILKSGKVPTPWAALVVVGITLLALGAVWAGWWIAAIVLGLWMILAIKGDWLIPVMIFVGGPVFLLLAILAM